MPVNYPKVSPGDVQNFARAWDLRGIKMILDETSLQFATDFANTAIRSYVDHLVEQAHKLNAEKAVQGSGKNADTTTNAVAAHPVPPSTSQKSLITLTDA